MSDPPPPNQPTAPPTEPGPGASREEWRAWRHQQHDYWRTQRYGGGGGWYGPWNWWGGGWWGSWYAGAALLVIGAYYLFQNLGLLNWLPGDVLWPLLLILLGLYLLLRRNRGWWP